MAQVIFVPATGGGAVQTVATVAELPPGGADAPYRTSDTNQVWIWDGVAWIPIGSEYFRVLDSWSGVETSKTYTTDGSVVPSRGLLKVSRYANWSLKDSSGSFIEIGVEFTFPSATQVTVTADVALPAGNYLVTGVA